MVWGENICCGTNDRAHCLIDSLVLWSRDDLLQGGAGGSVTEVLSACVVDTRVLDQVVVVIRRRANYWAHLTRFVHIEFWVRRG